MKNLIFDLSRLDVLTLDLSIALKRRGPFQLLSLFFLLHFCTLPTRAQDFKLEDLPSDIRKHVVEVRNTCKDYDPNFKPYNPNQGVVLIDLDGDGSSDFLVDNEHLCNDHSPGANCSNRGCDLRIWKQTGAHAWKLVFDEHLYRKFVSVDPANNKFNFMAVSIYAGDQRCHPKHDNYTSGQACDLLVYYDHDKFLWRLPSK